LGISNILWGFLFYVGLALISYRVLTQGDPDLRRTKLIRTAMIAAGLVYSSYLSWVQFSQLGEYCKLCLMSASIVALLAIVCIVEAVTKPETGKSDSMNKNPLMKRTSFLGGLAALVLVLAGADYLYFKNLDTAAADAVTEVSDSPTDALAANGAALAGGGALSCQYDASKARVENYRDFVSFSDPSIGDPNADVIVIEFFDPNCPHCKTLHPLMKVAADSLGSQARFVFRPFVLNQASLMQIEALHIAAQQGKFFEMLEAQYARQGSRSLSMDDKREISQAIGLDYSVLETRLSNQMYRSIALRQRQQAYEAGVTVVPTIMINGRIIDSSARSIACMAEMIADAS
jgi:protein-disulfide isomerase